MTLTTIPALIVDLGPKSSCLVHIANAWDVRLEMEDSNSERRVYNMSFASDSVHVGPACF